MTDTSSAEILTRRRAAGREPSDGDRMRRAVKPRQPPAQGIPHPCPSPRKGQDKDALAGRKRQEKGVGCWNPLCRGPLFARRTAAGIDASMPPGSRFDHYFAAPDEPLVESPDGGGNAANDGKGFGANFSCTAAPGRRRQRSCGATHSQSAANRAKSCGLSANPADSANRFGANRPHHCGKPAEGSPIARQARRAPDALLSCLLERRA